MRRLVTAAVLAGLAAPARTGTPPSPDVGEKVPEIEAVKWYNTPPLALANLQDQAVLVEVFRTW